MADWKINVDVSQVASVFGELKNQVEEAIVKGVGALAAATHAKALEMANEKLHTTSGVYKEALSFKKLEGNIWVVSLDMKKAGWIEDGLKPGFMKQLLNGKSAKTNADGGKYAIIPFQHNKNPTEQTPQAKEMLGQIKNFLKEKNIKTTKLEFNADGSPKMGLLHRFNIESSKPSYKAKYPALSGLAIYQRKNEKGKIKKEIMTFRIITEKHEQDGRWFHPGVKAANIIDETFFWAINEWDNVILPSILASFKD